MTRREITGRRPGVSADLIERGSGPPGSNEDDPGDDESDGDESDGSDDESDEDEATQRNQPAAQTIATLPPIRGPPRMAFNIPEFCEAFRISEDFYYKLKRQGQGPREMKIGARTLISLAAADEWRRAFEAQTEAATEKI